MDPYGRGFPLQSIGTDPNWTSQLSPNYAYWRKIDHEMSERQMEAKHPGWSKLTPGEKLDVLLNDLEKAAENGELGWATKEPVY